MHQEERMWPTVDDQAEVTCTDPECQVCEQPYEDDEPLGSFDLSDDADALASAGMGTDEDYGMFESYE